MKTIKVSISTPTGKVFEDNVKIINADIAEGRIGVMANHSPLVSSLKVSTFSVEFKDGKTRNGVVFGGIFNVGVNSNEKKIDNKTPSEVTILTTDFDWVDEIDIQATKNEIKNLEYQLQSPVSKMEEQSLGERMKYNELKLEV